MSDGVVQGILITVHLCPECKGSGKSPNPDESTAQWVCCGKHTDMRLGSSNSERRVCFGNSCSGMQRKVIRPPCKVCDGRRWVWRDQAVTHAIIQAELKTE